MPRSMAPPPSNEVSIVLTKPFSGTPTKKIEIFGEPNRSASIKVHTHSGGQGHTMLTTVGDIKESDFDELLGGCQQVRGLPSDPDSDIYGFDMRLVLTTFDIQWDNGDQIEGAESPANPTEENKQALKEVADRIEELGRKFAKRDAAV